MNTEGAIPTQNSCCPHNEFLEVRFYFHKVLPSHKFFLHPDLTPSCRLQKGMILILPSALWTLVKAAGASCSSEGSLKIRALGGHWQCPHCTWGVPSVPACCAITPAIHRCSNSLWKDLSSSEPIRNHTRDTYSPYLEEVLTHLF